MLLSLFRKDPAKKAARSLYETAVKQARSPYLYEVFATPDTVEGRFEQVSLHVYLILKRLQGEGADASQLGQKLFDTMFENMDDSLREMGVGDLSVAKKIRKLAEDFFGRSGVYRQAMAPEASDQALSNALSRNIYGQPGGARSSDLARYVRAVDLTFSKTALVQILAGKIEFPDPSSTQEDGPHK